MFGGETCGGSWPINSTNCADCAIYSSSSQLNCPFIKWCAQYPNRQKTALQPFYHQAFDVRKCCVHRSSTCFINCILPFLLASPARITNKKSVSRALIDWMIEVGIFTRKWIVRTIALGFCVSHIGVLAFLHTKKDGFMQLFCDWYQYRWMWSVR